EDAKRSFEQVFRQYGLPERIRSDNGPPFATTGVAGLSRLAIWWIRLGIRPERIERGKPQQNGRHERMHRTLKHALGKEPAADKAALQMQLDAFVEHYNQQRPHEAL
ncbi:integrase core domain-containing protein, partial [Delftia sp. WSY_14]